MGFQPSVRPALHGARTRTFRSLGLATLLVAAFYGSSCTDNPSCIFGGDCSDTITVGVGANAATFPTTGQWIRGGQPNVELVFPSGNQANPNTPIVITFSESMNPDSTAGAFAVFDTNTGIEVPSSSTLVGDGRVLLVFPGVGGGLGGGMETPTPLQPGSEYRVELVDGVVAFDLTGQLFTDADGIVGTFTVAENPSDIPAVLATWPPQGDDDASSLTEFVVIFDQPVDPTSVSALNIAVTVDGLPPQVPPVAFDQLMISAAFAQPVPEPRVWTFRNNDVDGEPIPLLTQVAVDGGALGEVEFQISPATNPIASLDMMQEVEPTTIAFTLGQIFPPVLASLISLPFDAIGIRNLVDPMGGEGDLAVDVILEQGLNGDVLEIWLFGVVLDGDGLPGNVAFQREVTLDADMNTVTLTELELDLAPTTTPLTTIVNDGDLGMAFRMRRGSEGSPVFVMDVDAATAGVQDVVLDITPPDVVGFGAFADSVVEFRSDQRHMTLFGTASEELRECDVTVTIGMNTFDNGANAPVLHSDSTGVFLASTVTLPGTGVVDPNGSTPAFTAILRDRAFNTTAVPIVGDFIQVGSSAPGTLVAPSAMIEVEVFDARDFTRLENAVVFSHQDNLGVITPLSAVVTDANGTALVASAAVGDTIITVDAADHDLFTFHGVSTTRISVPLDREEEIILVQSSVGVTTTPGTFSALTSFATDTRIDPSNTQLQAMDLCFVGPTGLESCTGSPFIRRGFVGSAAALGAVFPSGVGTYAAQSFLRFYSFALARPVVNSFGGDAVNIAFNGFLNDPGVADEELAVDWTPQPTVFTIATTGINLATLTGPPTVSVQANVPGQPGSLSVGLGVTFDDGGGGFDLRAAYAGIADVVQDTMADELGSMVTQGIIEPELRLRVELTEVPTAGTLLSNRAGARPKLSDAATMIFPLGVATILSPMPLEATGVSGFNVVFDGVIFDQIVGLGKRGLYRTTIQARDGRQWVLWRPDQNNLAGQPVTVHVPDISLSGGSSLLDDALTVSVSAFAWAGYDAQDFLWSDVEREYDLFSHTLPRPFNAPPP